MSAVVAGTWLEVDFAPGEALKLKKEFVSGKGEQS